MKAPTNPQAYTPFALLILITLQTGAISVWSARFGGMDMFEFWGHMIASCYDGLNDRNANYKPFRPDFENWFRDNRRTPQLDEGDRS